MVKPLLFLKFCYFSSSTEWKKKTNKMIMITYCYLLSWVLSYYNRAIIRHEHKSLMSNHLLTLKSPIGLDLRVYFCVFSYLRFLWYNAVDQLPTLTPFPIPRLSSTGMKEFKFRCFYLPKQWNQLLKTFFFSLRLLWPFSSTIQKSKIKKKMDKKIKEKKKGKLIFFFLSNVDL